MNENEHDGSEWATVISSDRLSSKLGIGLNVILPGGEGQASLELVLDKRTLLQSQSPDAILAYLRGYSDGSASTATQIKANSKVKFK